MIWQSIWAMTAFDLAVIAIVAHAILYFFSVRERLLRTTTPCGLFAIGFGLSAIAFFFVLDLAAMHLLPLFMPRATAMNFMDVVLIQYLWLAIPVGIGAITLGLRVNASRMLGLVDDLRESEQLLKATLNASPAGITLRDTEGRFLFVNDAAAGYLGEMGFDAASLIGKSLDRFDAPAPHGRTGDDLIQQVVATGEAIANMEFRQPRAPCRTFLTNVAPIFAPDDRVASVLMMNLDVTEQRETEAALKASEANFRNLIVGSIQGICILDPDRKLLFANQAYADIFGYDSPQEILALETTAALTAPYEQDRLSRYRKARLRGEDAPDNYEYDGLRKDGSTLRLQVMPRRVIWRGQAADQITLFDISEKNQIEQTLHDVIDSLQEGFALYDPDDRLVVCNDEYKRLHPAARDIIEPGMLFEDMIQETVEQGSFADVKGSVEAMTRQRMEMHRNPKSPFMRNLDDGTRYIVKETRTPEGGYFVSVTDITELARAEEKLHQAQKMEAVGQLTGGMAHDFNNLLGVIIGNLDFLREELQSRDDLVELVDTATKAALGGATLNRQLLAFSRNQPLAPKAIDPNRQITGMLDILRRTLGGEIFVETVLNKALWACKVDPVQVESALLNLAINARDAMQDGGTLTIETDNVRLDDEYAAAQLDVKPGEYVILTVTDSGTGMSAAVLDQVFEPFFTTKAVGKGSGLGLSMVFGFAKQSGGHIEIESEIGAGTTVKLYLPRARSAAASAAANTGSSPKAKGETVLVVEDNPDVLTLAATLVGSLGYNVLEAKDGKMALQEMECAAGVDLLLTDMAMPGGMDGPALATEAAVRHPGLKVLYMSGHAPDLSRRQGQRGDVTPLLQKPFRKPELARMMRTALDC